MKFSPLQKLNVSMLVLASFIIFVPFASHAAPSTLVIDEFMIAGKTSYDEYLVIDNYGSTQVPMSGYKVMKYTATGNSSTIFSSFGDFNLEPNDRVMVCHNNFLGDRLPHTFVYNPSSSTPTMAPNNSISLLDSKGAVLDLVGFGMNGDAPVKLFEGEAIEPTPPAYQVLTRSDGFDSDHNNMDFSPLVKPVVIDPNAARLVINELLPNPDSGDEWFELYNPTNHDVSLSNLKICDSMGARHCYSFDSADSLAAGVFKIYSQSETKITMNNDGDWLELYDATDNLLSDSGGDYGTADKGVSLALFGTEYQWTKTLTPGAQNVFTDTIEIEVDTALPAPKTTKAKVSTTKKTVVSSSAVYNPPASATEAAQEVKAAETATTSATTQKPPVSRQTIGWALIILAILLVVGYTCWYFRSYAKNIYDKIRRRDDSARF